MFEKFTEDAIKVITHSRQEARRLEFNCVQSEHLFLGILHERVGVCSLALGKLDIDLKKARRVVERLIGRGYSNTPLDNISFDLHVMEIISNAVTLAKNLGENTVSAVHILLSLIKADNPDFKKIFPELNIDAEDIETELKLLWQKENRESEEIEVKDLPEHFSYNFLTNEARAVLDDAAEETIKQKHIFMDTEQLLYSLTKDKFAFFTTKLLKKYGLDETSVRVEMHRMVGPGSGARPDLLQKTAILEKALEHTWLEAKNFKYGKVGTGHLLAGIMAMENCTSTHILRLLNIDPEQIKWETLYLLRKYNDYAEPPLSQKQIEHELNPEVLNEALSRSFAEKEKALGEDIDFD